MPGLAMRRIASLCAGEVKTNAYDAAVIAKTARSKPHTLRSLRLANESLATRLIKLALRMGERQAQKSLRRLANSPSLFLSAFAALSDSIWRAYYTRKIQQGKRQHQALTAPARRRCDVLFVRLRDEIFYRAPNA